MGLFCEHAELHCVLIRKNSMCDNRSLLVLQRISTSKQVLFFRRYLQLNASLEQQNISCYCNERPTGLGLAESNTGYKGGWSKQQMSTTKAFSWPSPANFATQGLGVMSANGSIICKLGTTAGKSPPVQNKTKSQALGPKEDKLKLLPVRITKCCLSNNFLSVLTVRTVFEGKQ